MTFARFDERYHLGHSGVDEQHAKLFNAINQLHEAMQAGHAREELGRILAFLRLYTVKHFADEEALMEASAFPGLLRHRQLHQQFTARVADLERQHTAGQMALSLTIFRFLKDWLATHIDQEDRRVVDHLRTWESRERA